MESFPIYSINVKTALNMYIYLLSRIKGYILELIKS